MLGGDGDISRAHQGIRARGEYGQWFALALDLEADFETLRTPDPVALHGFYRVRPARQFVQAVEQFVGVVGDLQKPLRNLAPLDQGAGAPAATVDHLLVGEHGLVDRIPVDHRVLAIGQALLEQAHEHALFVHVVIGLAGGEFARPVDRVAHRLELCAHMLDIGVSPFRRRGIVLDRRVFRRQAERIPAHRLQHVLAEHALVAADHIADRVVAHMAHVQRAGRIRQHRQAIKLRLRGIFLRLEGARVVPEFLRSGFNGCEIVGFLHGLRMLARARER